MHLRVGSSNRTETDDQITVRVAKGKSVSASGARHTRDHRCGQKRARKIVSSRPDPAPSQTSPPLTGIGGGFSIYASMRCMPATPEMEWRCASSMSDCTSPTGQPAALAKDLRPCAQSLGTELTRQADTIQDEIPQFARMGLDERTQPRVCTPNNAALLKFAFDQPHKMMLHGKLAFANRPQHESAIAVSSGATQLLLPLSTGLFFPPAPRELPSFYPATCSQICERY
jgi:hypothetical protein